MSERLTPQVMIGGAFQYLDAAIKIVPAPKTAIEKFRNRSVDPVVYYLVGHSIELSLKSFLMLRGVTKTELQRTYSHDLEKIVKTCRRKKLGNVVRITTRQVNLIKLLNAPYKGKLLEYTETGIYTLPAYWEILEVAQK